MVATEFVPKSHEKVALENLTLVLMQSARKRTGLVLISANYVTKSRCRSKHTLLPRHGRH